MTGAPYLARCSRDVGYHRARPETLNMQLPSCVRLRISHLAPPTAPRRLDADPVSLFHQNTALGRKLLHRTFTVDQRGTSAGARQTTRKPIRLKLPSFRKQRDL